MRQLGLAILAAMLPAGALAQDIYIRLEARRDAAEVRAAVERYAREAGDVVTYPSGATWTAIGLGPFADRAEARARLDELKQRRIAPQDAFVTEIEDGARITRLADLRADGEGATATAPTPDAGADGADGAADGPTTAGAATAEPPESPQPGDDIAAAEASEDSATESPAAAAPETHIRLEAFANRAAAEAARARWDAVLPGAALWQLPDGWFAIALGPVDAEAAPGWLAAWKAAGAIPGDAFATTADRLGAALIAGHAPELTDPPAPLTMPDPVTVQEALRWAGRYDGAIDGKPGPQTSAALAAELAAQGIDPASPNAEARAMRALLDRRAAWRDEMGLGTLHDPQTGLALTVPLDALEFQRVEHGLSIYGPRDGSGAALILFDQPGGQAEMADLAGFITALGWVGHPVREIGNAGFTLDGDNDTHIGHAEGHLQDGRIRGFVLIWPQGDAENAPRLRAIAAESLTHAPPPEAP